MKKLQTPYLVSCLVALAFGTGAKAQTSYDVERSRITNERAALEAGFSEANSACYKKYLVNTCLDELREKRSMATADLRRQEISLDDQERKLKGARQIQKTEDKTSPEKQQQAADKRGAALKDFEERMERDQEKSAARKAAVTNKKLDREGEKSRAKNQQEKSASRADKQKAATEALKRYDQRLEKARQREVRLASEKASQTKPSAQPLPVPN